MAQSVQCFHGVHGIAIGLSKRARSNEKLGVVTSNYIVSGF